MNITGKRIMQKFLAIVIILAMTMADVCLIGLNIVSYAIDSVSNPNVEFKTYFLDETQSKEKTASIEEKGLKIGIEVSVKKDGYLENGKIELGEDANFKFRDEKSQDGRTINLSQINEEDTAKIEVGIEFKHTKNNEFPTDYLNLTSQLNLSGTYVNSKNVDKDQKEEITGSSSLRVIWQEPSEVQPELKVKLLTNSIYSIEGEEKRIVQFLVTSKIKNNSYPVKSTNIEISGLPEGTTAYARTTAATNGDKQEIQTSYSNEGVLTILAQNGKNNIMSWEKGVEDQFVVTAQYDKDENVEGKEITVNGKITTIDNRELQTLTESKNIAEEKDGIVSIKNTEGETSFAKGKLYAGEERPYKVYSDVNIDFVKPIEKIIIEEEQTEGTEYTKTYIDKANFEKLFGANGEIRFEDQAGNEMSYEINEASGYIVATYPAGTTSIKIKTSKPEQEGILKTINNKKVTKLNLSKEEIKQMQEIEDKANVIYVKANNEESGKKKDSSKIALTETKSKANIVLNNPTLATEQKTIEMKVVLDSSTEDKMLYKNPELKIKLPKQIERISKVEYVLYNGRGLTRENISIDGRNIIIKLNGEQTAYSNLNAELNITATIEMNKLATNSNEKVVLTYTNENGLEEGEQTAEAGIVIQSSNSMIVTNNIAEYNVTTIGSGNRQVDLETGANAKTATVEMKIINNEDSKISNVVIKGTTVNIAGKIEKTGKVTANKEGAQISENNGEYTVTIASMEKGEEVDLSYNIAIAKNLPYNLSTETGYTVTYINDTTGKQATPVKATTLLLTTGTVAELKTGITAEVGGVQIKSGDEVKAGEIITYKVTVNNIGRKDAENTTIKVTIPTNTTLVELNPKYGIQQTGEEKEEEKEKEEEYFIEKQDKTISKTETIKSGETKTYTYMVRVHKSLAGNANGEFELDVNYNGKDETPVKFANAFTKGNLATELRIKRQEEKLYAGYNVEYVVYVDNLSNKEQKNIQVKINKNDVIELITSIISGQEEKLVEANNLTFTIDSIPAGERKEILFNTVINKPANNTQNAEISAIIKDNESKTYRTNKVTKPVESIEVSTNLSTTKSTNQDYLHAGDQVKYTIKVKNTGKLDANNLTIKDQLSDYLQLESVKLNGTKVEYETEANYEGNYNEIVVNAPLKVGESATLEITGKVREIPSDEILKVSNKAFIYNGILVGESSEDIKYIETELAAKKREGGQNSGENPSSNDPTNGEPGSNNSGENPNPTEGRGIISGTVWEDKNQNGSRDSGETLLEEIRVNAINISTNKIVNAATTNAEGFYTLSLPKGNYIIAFEYDIDTYTPTIYQAKGVNEDRNSDAVRASKVIDGEERVMAYTDTIALTQGKANIDLGLAEAKTFKLELEKVVSKMIITNSSGTKTYNFEDTNLAKVEIAGKDLNSSNVVIEYKIKVTNTGEIAGYAKTIVDHMPAAMTFNSSLNSDWYKKGNDIYTTALANTKIEPGETKEVKLLLTKKMTENNTGLTNNKAEIEVTYNSLGLPNMATETNGSSSDKNGGSSEVNKGSADTIIGVKTGGAVSYVALTLTIVVMICGAAYLVNKKLLVEKIEI